jgi:flagellar hook-length control protein FliK
MNIFPGQMTGSDSFDCSPKGPRAPEKPGQGESFAGLLGGSARGHDPAGDPSCQRVTPRQAPTGGDRPGSAVLSQRLDAADRADILDVLKAQGVSEDLLKDIESFLEQNPELKLGEVLERVAALLEGAVSDLETAVEDLASLERLLEKSGMDPKEVETALAALQQGDRIGFLDHLQSALSEHESSFGVSHQELSALLKALGLDARGFKADGAHAQNLHQPGSEELNRLIELGKGKDGFSGQDLKALLDGLKESLARTARPSEPKGEEIAHLARQLRQLLNSSEPKASAGELQQAGRPMPGPVRILSDSAQNQAKDQDPDLKPGLKDLMARGAPVQSATTSGLGQESQAGGSGEGDRNPWKSLLDKLEQLPGKQGAEGKSGDFSLARSEQSLKSLTDKAETAKELLQRPNIRQSVVDQVRGGMLKNLGQGRSELTLQLNPPDLGKISLVLQVQDKDVLGMLKTTSPEVSRFIQQNLHTIQKGLEEQGLKVQKLDVQTQLAQEDSSHWQGQEGHNQAREHREQLERQEWLKRWRNGDWLDPEEGDPGSEEALRLLNRDGLSVLA